METIVALGREVGGCACCHAFADRATVENDDVFAGLGQLVGDGHAGDAGANHHHIGPFIAVERWCILHHGCVHPH
jgi:hypothetical protein